MSYIANLYDKTGSKIIGQLDEILEEGCYVEEERNGIFELTFSYPNNNQFSDFLINENIIEVQANDIQGLQRFRIYDTKCFMANIITVFAKHISFDLVNDHVENVKLENASCEYALNTLFRKSHFSTHYRGYSDIINAQNFKIDNVNILNAIAGKEGSIIDTYGNGAEIIRDNTNIHVLNKRGHENDVSIEFGKNLTDFVLERDLTDLETRVGGFAKYTTEDNKEVIVKSNWIDSPYIDNFAHPYISIEGRRDYSDRFKEGEIPTVEKLDKLCIKEFKVNKRDIPKSNYTIKFIPLSKCLGYENSIQDKINLCDTVRIIDKRFNVDTKAKVIKYKYNFVKNRYESMELGEPRTNLGDVISGKEGVQGPPGKDGKPGPPGKDADSESMPDTLPVTPIISTKVFGMGTVEISWTFENKMYYSYEVYASKNKSFKPNIFDLIYSGQASSFLFKAKPGETWYFRVCAINTHGNRTPFSEEVQVKLKKIEDMNNYFSEAAIGQAVIQSLTTDYMEAGIIKGHWIDARNLSVTDGNGVRTLDIDSFGNITLLPTKLKVLVDGKFENVSTKSEIIQLKDIISSKVSKTAFDNEKNLVKDAISEINQRADTIESKVSRKLEESELSSRIQQSSTDIQIGFNGINDRISINSQYMVFTAPNGNKDMLLYGGQLCVYNNMNDTFMGTIGSVLRNNTSGFLGTGLILSKHCNAFTICRDSSWDNILTNRSPNPTHWFLLDFNSNELRLGMDFLSSNINMRGHKLYNVVRGEIQDLYTHGLKDYTTGESMFRCAGHSMVNDMDWSWGGKNLMNPKLFNDKFYYTNGHLAFGKNDYNNNMMNGVNWDWQGYNIVNAHIYAAYETGGHGYSVGAATSSIETKMLQEDFAEYDEEKGLINVDINKAVKEVYARNLKLEEERELLFEENRKLKNVIDTLLLR